jgi:hypothetical protein
VITSYTHLGEDIGFDEVMRFREELGKTLEVVQQQQQVDSPIYTVLRELQPPSRRQELKQAVPDGADAAARAAEAASSPRRTARASHPSDVVPCRWLPSFPMLPPARPDVRCVTQRVRTIAAISRQTSLPASFRASCCASHTIASFAAA